MDATLRLRGPQSHQASIRAIAWRAFLDISVRRMKHYYRDLVDQALGDLRSRDGQLISQEDIQHQVDLTLATMDHAMDPDEGIADASPAAGVPSEPSWGSSGRKWLMQIEKDLPRTFPKGPLKGSDTRKTALRRILAAYALRNPSVGYCQGLNFVAGMLLTSGMEEEDTFYSLCTIVEDVLQVW